MPNTKIFPIRLKPHELQWFREIAQAENCESTADAVRLAGRVYLALSAAERQRALRRIAVQEYTDAERERLARLVSGV